MNRDTLRLLALLRRVLCERHALLPGTLPPAIDEAVEELLMPGYRERRLAHYLASVPPEGKSYESE
jgi:hypothetical protein